MELVSLQEAAKKLNRAEDSVRKMIIFGTLKSVRTLDGIMVALDEKTVRELRQGEATDEDNSGDEAPGRGADGPVALGEPDIR